MARYLVVAYESATSPELMDQLRTIKKEDPAARMTLVVPEAPASHTFTSDIEEARRDAYEAVRAAERMYREADLPLDAAQVGSGSPVAAVEDALREHPDFDAVVLSTPPPGSERWIDMDFQQRVERTTKLPVIYVEEGQPVATSANIPPPPPQPEAAPRPVVLPPERRANWGWIGLLMVVYLFLIGGLALGVSSGFFVLDLVAICVFTVIVLGFWFTGRSRGTRVE